MKKIIIIIFCSLISHSILADTLDLRTADSEIVTTHAIKLSNLTYNNIFYTVTLYLNINGSWSLSSIANNSSLDLTTANSEIIASNAIKLTGLSYDGKHYDTNLIINLDGSWQVSNLTSHIDNSETTSTNNSNGSITENNSSGNETNNSSSSVLTPSKVPTSCAEKSVAFSTYSSTSISCTGNTININSSTGIPQRSDLDEDKMNIGIESWIGRVPLPRSSSWTIPINPSYLNAIESNISIHDPIGISVDGIPILHYAKESYNGEIADLSINYSDRDTVLLGELDQCGAHAGNGEDYHYHYAPLCMMDKHDPNQPLAYMFDGLPLYFGTAGGIVSEQGGITSVNYGGGRYSHLDYRPEEVKNGNKSLDACNAYDINGDGATSGYVYYTTKDAPYTIGCYRAVANQRESVDVPPRWDQERNISWSGSEVLITDYYQKQFDGNLWTFMEMTPRANNSKLATGTTGVILYRQLNSGENDYVAGMDCWSFRYRMDASDSSGINDSIEWRCR